MSHTLKQAWEILRESQRLLEADQAKKKPATVDARASGKSPKAKPGVVAAGKAKPMDWPIAVAELARLNNWSKAKAAAELEKLPDGRELRERYIKTANAEHRERVAQERKDAASARAALARR